MIKLFLKKSYLVSTIARLTLMTIREILPLFKLSFLLPLKPNIRSHKFIILAQTRSGTHLLCDLLNSHPDILCDAELFDQDIPRLFSPIQYIEGLRNTHKQKAFGFILHLRHLLMMKNIEQDHFISQLQKNGWSIIYIERLNVLHQQISLEIGKQSRLWHIENKSNLPKDKYKLDLVPLLSRMRLREIKEALLKEILSNVSYHKINYESDLLIQSKHQSTLDKVFHYLGLSTNSVSTTLIRTSNDSLETMVENYTELEEMMIKNGYEKYLLNNNEGI